MTIARKREGGRERGRKNLRDIFIYFIYKSNLYFIFLLMDWIEIRFYRYEPCLHANDGLPLYLAYIRSIFYSTAIFRLIRITNRRSFELRV